MHTPIATDGQYYNPGYEHLKSIYHLKKAQVQVPLQAAIAYVLPLLAMQSACLAIEEYVNLTGQKFDPAWNEYDRNTLPVKERIAYVYEKMEQPLSFERGIWKEVLELFETTGLIKGDLSKMKRLHKEEIPVKFKDVAVEYPIYRSQAIAEEAIDILLDQSDICKALKRSSALVK